MGMYDPVPADVTAGARAALETALAVKAALGTAGYHLVLFWDAYRREDPDQAQLERLEKVMTLLGIEVEELSRYKDGVLIEEKSTP